MAYVFSVMSIDDQDYGFMDEEARAAIVENDIVFGAEKKFLFRESNENDGIKYIVPDVIRGWYINAAGKLNHGTHQTMLRYKLTPAVYSLKFNSYSTRRWGFARNDELVHEKSLSDYHFVSEGTTFTVNNTQDGYEYMFVYGVENEETEIDIDLLRSNKQMNMIDNRVAEWVMGSIGTGGSLGRLIESTERCRSPYFYIGDYNYYIYCQTRTSNGSGRLSIIEYDEKMNAIYGVNAISGGYRTHTDTKYIRMVVRAIDMQDFTASDIPDVIKDVYFLIDCPEYESIPKKYYCGTGCGLNVIECLKELENYHDDHKEMMITAGTYNILTQLGGNDFLASVTQDDTAYTIGQPWIRYGKTKIVGLGNVKLNYPATEEQAIAYPYAANLISVLNVQGNVEVENITIIAQYCRYCVHDETAGDDDYAFTEKTYRNCIFIHNAKREGQTGGQTIGGGCDNGQRITIESCRIENNNGASAVSWHNRDGVGGCVFVFNNSDFITSGYSSIRFGNVLKRPMNQVYINGCYMNEKIFLNPESGDTDSWVSFQLYLTCCNDVTITISSSLDLNDAEPIVRNTIVSAQ